MSELVAVIGARGQLGQELCRLLGPAALPLTHDDIELTNPASVRSALQGHDWKAVVNVAAYNWVDRAEDEPSRAFEVNAFGPRYVAEVCRDLGAPFVHISTDYVFGRDEGRQEPYREEEAPGPVNVYGTSKLAGEHLALLTNEATYVLRTCGVYGLRGRGGKGGNFVETMLRLAAEGRSLRVVADQRCTPTYAVDLAHAIVELLQRKPAYGIYHVTNAGECSWFDFACAIFEAAGLQVECQPITSEQYPTRARRPRYSVLSNDRWQTVGLTPLRPWRDALTAYLEERKAFKEAGG